MMYHGIEVCNNKERFSIMNKIFYEADKTRGADEESRDVPSGRFGRFLCDAKEL